MDQHANALNRPIIVATAALTVALGLTVASLGGYLRPRDAARPAPVTAEPVDPTPPEPVLASYTPHEEHEHTGGHHREHGREHEDD